MGGLARRSPQGMPNNDRPRKQACLLRRGGLKLFAPPAGVAGRRGGRLNYDINMKCVLNKLDVKPSIPRTIDPSR